MANLLSDVFDLGTIKLDLDGKSKEKVFEELIFSIVTLYPEYDKAEIFSAVKHREEQMTSGIGSGVAVIHVSCKTNTKMVGAIGISQHGIDYGASDNKPVHVVFLLVKNEKGTENQLYVLNRIFQLTQSEVFTQIKNAKNVEAIHKILTNVHLARGV